MKGGLTEFAASSGEEVHIRYGRRRLHANSQYWIKVQYWPHALVNWQLINRQCRYLTVCAHWLLCFSVEWWWRPPLATGQRTTLCLHSGYPQPETCEWRVDVMAPEGEQGVVIFQPREQRELWFLPAASWNKSSGFEALTTVAGGFITFFFFTAAY